MSSNYKLIYFNVRGRAELARLILHCADVPFEDFRFEGIEWEEIKPSITSYQLSLFIQLDVALVCLPLRTAVTVRTGSSFGSGRK